MACRLFILEEAEEVEIYSGEISDIFLDKIIVEAVKNNLIFLSSIDSCDDTIFNVEQLKEIKDELMSLESGSISDHSEFAILLEAIDSTINEGQSTYLRISCYQSD